MPSSPPRICSRCRRTHCDCRAIQRKEWDERRGTAAERGYDHRWRTFRLSYLARHPLCTDCESQGLVRPAVHIHHIKKLRDHPEYKYDEQWLMPLCETCHNVRTAKGE